jgi:hypothetical protein
LASGFRARSWELGAPGRTCILREIAHNPHDDDAIRFDPGVTVERSEVVRRLADADPQDGFVPLPA